MNQVPVVQVWSDKVSRIAHACTYTALAADQIDRWYGHVERVPTKLKRLAAEFCAAKQLWYETVDRWRVEGLPLQQYGKLYNCRYAGVTLVKARSSFSCGFRLCPFCYFRAKAKLIRAHEALLSASSLWSASVDIPVAASVLFNQEAYKAFLGHTVVPARQWLLAHTGAKNGFVTVNLLSPAVDAYRVQLVAVARELGNTNSFEIPNVGSVLVKQWKSTQAFTLCRVQREWFAYPWSTCSAIAKQLSATRVVNVT